MHVAIIHLWIVYCCIYAIMHWCINALMHWCINAECTEFHRPLSVFFKILPICNTGISVADIWATVSTVRFFYPLFDREYYFQQLAYQDLQVPKCFLGLNQMQWFPSFDSNWGKRNDPIAFWHQLHLWYQVSQKEKCLSYPPDCVGGVTESLNCVGVEGLFPLEIPFNGVTTHAQYLGQIVAEKPSTF